MDSVILSSRPEAILKYCESLLSYNAVPFQIYQQDLSRLREDLFPQNTRHQSSTVGSDGSKEKVDLLKTKFGFDEAFNYKEEQGLVGTLKSSFKYERTWPDCSLWNDRAKRIHVKGFTVFGYWHMYLQFLETTIKSIKEGKMAYVKDIVEGLENAPSALVGLLSGRNVGKQVVLVARE
ncbi:hypothetical protein AMTRI_Chr06g173940 [Amborella trichopoda]